MFFRCSFQVLSSWCSHTYLNKPGEPLVLTESGKSPFQLRGTISNEQALAYIRSGTSNSWYVVNQLLCWIHFYVSRETSFVLVISFINISPPALHRIASAFQLLLTEPGKSPASIAQSNKQRSGTCLYHKWDQLTHDRGYEIS